MIAIILYILLLNYNYQFNHFYFYKLINIKFCLDVQFCQNSVFFAKFIFFSWNYLCLMMTAGVCVIESSASTVTSLISVPKTDFTLCMVFISVESDF